MRIRKKFVRKKKHTPYKPSPTLSHYNAPSMSYGSHKGGSTNGRANPDHVRDRDRENGRPIRSDGPERDRTESTDRYDRTDRADRGYSSRHGTTQKRHSQPQSNHSDHSAGPAFRRQDGGRDFYGHRNTYNRTDASEWGHNNGGTGPSNARRRDRSSQHDLYSGSKYRPGGVKPKGLGQGPDAISSRGPGGPRHDPHPKELSSKDFKDDRRPHVRKQDWDSTMSHNSKQAQQRLQRAPGDRQTHRLKDEAAASINASSGAETDPVGVVKSAVHEGRSILPSNKHHKTTSHSPPDEDLPIIQPSLDASLLPKKLEGAKSPLAVVPSEEAGAKLSSEARPDSVSNQEPDATSRAGDKTDHEHDQGISHPSDKTQKKTRLLALFDDEEDGVQTVDKAASSENSKIGIENPASGKTEDIASPSSNGFDTSVLSPVGSPTSDDAFVQTLNVVAESVHANDLCKVEETADLSETETVTEGRPLDLTKSRLFLRNKVSRGRSKRRNVVLSEDEEISSDEAADYPMDLETVARRDEPYLSKPSSKVDLCAHENVTPDVGGLELSVQASDFARGEADLEMNKGPSPLQKDSSKNTYKIKRDSTGRSQLQRACKKGDLSEVKNLIGKGASANESDFGGFTCLHEAALAGHTDIVEYLIASGADVNKQALEAGNFETPLMDAAENKHVGTVEALMKSGADPHLCNNNGYSTITKLFHLQEDDEEYEDVIKAINNFAPSQTNSELSKVTHAPREIIEDPAEGYFVELVKKKSHTLIYKYAAQGNKESAAEDFVTRAYSLLKMPDVLNLAARNGHVELVDILLGLNPGSFDINQLNRFGVNALLSSVGRGYYDVVKFLLSKGADPRIKRTKDGLTALEIAKHSAQYDPREVVILENIINGKSDTTSQEQNILKTRPSSPNLNISDNESVKVATSEKTSLSQGNNGLAQIESSGGENEALTEKCVSENVDAQSNIIAGVSKSLEASEKNQLSEGEVVKQESCKRVTSIKRNLSSDDLSLHKKPRSFSSNSAVGDHLGEGKSAIHSSDMDTISTEAKEADTPSKSQVRSSLPVDHGTHIPSTSANSPISSPKIHEEQRLRAAEQARIWQEKVQAKKKARKEMFLLAEKEKEKRRKAEEEKRLELIKKQEAEQMEQKKIELLEAKKFEEDLKKKKQLLEYNYMLRNYPIGLQDVNFDGKFERDIQLKYTPLYVFNVENESWVIDMQVALLLAISVQRVHSILKSDVGPEIDTPSKDKLWSIFFKMIGVGKNNVIDANGLEKFRCLLLRFVKLDDVADCIKQEHLEAYNILWGENRLARVELASLEPARPSASRKDLNRPSHCLEVGFIPPKFRQREDVLRTIQTANAPLW